MNILYYIPDLKQEYGGMRQYTAGMLKELTKLTECNIFVYHNSRDVVIHEILNSHTNLKLVTNLDVNINDTYRKLKYKLISFINRITIRLFKIKIVNTSAEISLIDKIIDKFNIKIIHCPYQYIPDTNNAKIILTMHDVQELHFPEFFPADERGYRAIYYNKFIKKADAVIVSYEHIKNDIIKYFNKSSNSFYTILLKMDNLWCTKYQLDKNKYILDKCDKYLLYPANAWKHKNHINLFKAIILLREVKNTKVFIKLTGDFSNEYGQQLKAFVIANDLEEQIIFEGIVSETRLFELYVNAQGVVIPTLYEAGSFPLVECILIGVPVICSNVTSLPETICNDLSLFNPNNIEQISEKIKNIWDDTSFRQSVMPKYSASKRLVEIDNSTTLLAMYKSIIH